MSSLTRYVRWFPGIALVFYGGSMALDVAEQQRGFEKVEGTISGFHFHADDPNDLHPTVSFMYRGDTISRHLGPADPLPQKGQIVMLSFPRDKPEVARILPIEWYWPSIVMLAGVWWLGTLLFILKLNSHKTTAQKAAIKTTRDSDLPRLILFTSLAVLLTWLTYYFTKTKLAHPDNSTEWGGLILLGFLALLFTAMCALGWWSRVIGAETILVEAGFTRLIGPEVLSSRRGELIYQWKLECEWTDPVTGKLITFVSKPFQGRSYYYTRSSILVSVHPKNPTDYYVVDLSFLSTTNDNGITLITPVDYEIATQRAEPGSQSRKLPWFLRIIARPVNYLASLMKKYPQATRLVGVLLTLSGAQRSRWERDFDEPDSGEEGNPGDVTSMGETDTQDKDLKQ